MSQLAGGGGTLTSGLSQLTAGAGALQIGLGQLTNGAGQLATGLSGGVSPGRPAHHRPRHDAGRGGQVARADPVDRASSGSCEAQSPGIFNSGYFVLAAVEGATTSNRNAATFTINLLRGGTAGQILVVSKYKSSDPRRAGARHAASRASPDVRQAQQRPGRGRRTGGQPR